MTTDYTSPISPGQGTSTASVSGQQLAAAPDAPTVIAESVTESVGTSTVTVIGNEAMSEVPDELMKATLEGLAQWEAKHGLTQDE